MYDLLIVISRWIFIAIGLCFLLLAGHAVLGERGLTEADQTAAVRRQRVLLILMHMLAFTILLLRNNAFDWSAVVTGGLSLAFLLFAMLTCGRIYRDSDPLMWNAMLFLLDIGFITLQRLSPGHAQRQLMIAAIGFGAMLVVPLALKIVPRFEKLSWFYAVIGLALLASPLLTERLFSAQTWLTVGVLTFQPSEVVKLVFVFFLASVLYEKPGGVKLLIVCGAAAAFVLVLVLQSDLGGALIFFMTFIILLYISTGNTLLVLLAAGLASVAAYASYFFFDHVQTRVDVWLNPFADVADKGYQITQSLFAITTNGLIGAGLTRGSANTIPVVMRDFIFAAICEEFGVLFALLLIGVLLLLFYRGVHIALRCKSPLYALLSVGLTGMLAFQTFIIIGGDIKLIPMTGVTLPFISYGGTSIVVCLVTVGVLQWLYSMIPLSEKARRQQAKRGDDDD